MQKHTGGLNANQHTRVRIKCAVLQSQKATAAYFNRKRLLASGFEAAHVMNVLCDEAFDWL